MYQIDNSTAVTPMPTPAAVGPNPNYFFGPNTVVTADWLNAVMMEIISVLDDAGVTPDKTDQGQLLEAINILIASAPAVLAADLNTAGYAIENPSGDIDFEPSTGKVAVAGGVGADTVVGQFTGAPTIAFNNAQISLLIAAATMFDVQASGLQLGNTGARVTQIDNDTTMAADSSTRLATQHAFKTYADTRYAVAALPIPGFTDTPMAATETWYLSEGDATSTINAAYSFIMPCNGTLSNFIITTDVAPGGSDTYTATLMKGASTTAITCTLTSNQNSDNTNTVSVVAGDAISIRLVLSATAATINRAGFTVFLTPA
ncbi:MAG: hypothetical protein K5Q00_00175 [Gammaproteobacteria bacterium]|nr:hypothetical protein [Gammaproteobacteria bacterium]